MSTNELKELQVQKSLRSGNSLTDLENEYFVTSKQHSKFPELYLLKYNQIESNFGEKIVRECRTLILNSKDNWNVVGRGFDKFLNCGEKYAADIDWASAEVQEKADGSYFLLFNYQNEWHVSTSGTPDASGNTDTPPLTFEQYFWNTAKDENLQLPCDEYNDYCFLLELTGPHNHIVIFQPKASLTVLGMRNKITGQEYSAKEASEILKIKPTKTFSYNSVSEVYSSLNNFSGLVQEGYVVVDKNFNRIKIKHPDYLLWHRAKGKLNSKTLLEIIRIGESEEALSIFPHLQEKFDIIKQKYLSLIVELENEYEKIKYIEEQKFFAFEAIKTKCSGALFALRANKVKSIKEHLQKVNIDSLFDLLQIKEEV